MNKYYIYKQTHWFYIAETTSINFYGSHVWSCVRKGPCSFSWLLKTCPRALLILILPGCKCHLGVIYSLLGLFLETPHYSVLLAPVRDRFICIHIILLQYLYILTMMHDALKVFDLWHNSKCLSHDFIQWHTWNHRLFNSRRLMFMIRLVYINNGFGITSCQAYIII